MNFYIDLICKIKTKSNSDLTLIHDIDTPIKIFWNVSWVLFKSEGSVWLIRMLFQETTKADSCPTYVCW